MESIISHAMISIFILSIGSQSADALIYESRVNRICAYALNRTNTEGLDSVECLLSGLTYAVGVAVDRADGTLFYSDIGTLEIRSYDATNKPGGTGDRILYGFGSIEDMAVDWVAKNLYTADQSFRQIAVSRYDGTMRSVLVQEDVGKPRSIALHPEMGYMFWADYGGLPSIERAGLDGSDRTTIVEDNIQFPNGLAIDYDKNIIYFADRGSDNIASVDLDGGNRQLVHYQFGGDFFDMVLVEEFLYVTSWTAGATKGYITTIRDIGEANQTVEFEVISHNNYALGITADDADNQPDIDSRCLSNNGGCEQLCFPQSNAKRVCGCSSGYTADGNTCVSVPYEDDFILVADSAQRRIFQVPIPSDDSTDDTGLGGAAADTSVKALPLDGLEYPVAVTYDPVEKHVYWTDLTTGSISKAALDGSFKQTIVFDNNVHVGIAIDTKRRRIYWTDEDRDVIEVANLDGSGRQIIVQVSLNEPRGIVVDIQTGDIYWTDWGDAPKIEKASQSGTRREILVTENLNFPNGITIDPEERILYWCDSNFPDNSKIEQYDLTTGQRSTIATLPAPSQPYGVTIFGTFIYWSDWVKGVVYRVDRFATDPLAESVGETVMLGMQGIVSSQVFTIVTTNAPAVTQPNSDSGSLSAAVPAAIGAIAFVVIVIIVIVVVVVCMRRSKENRRLTDGRSGSNHNDYHRTRSLPPKTAAAEPPPLPDGHPAGDPLYMDLDEFRRDPPPPYCELNLKENPANAAASQSFKNPAFESDGGGATARASSDLPDGMAPPPPPAAGGYMPYLKNNADHEDMYMTPDATEAGVDDSFYEIANA